METTHFQRVPELIRMERLNVTKKAHIESCGDDHETL